MGMNNHHKAEISTRREMVARLRLRGMTQREIIAGLLKHTEPDGTPAPIIAALGTVNNDLKALLAEWRANAAQDIATLKAKQIAEIAEGKRRAWTDGNLSALIGMWKLESDIYGTSAPTKVEITDWRDALTSKGADAEATFRELVDKLEPKLLQSPAMIDTPQPAALQPAETDDTSPNK